ncbi:unnamed protein product [Urochloa humidicola]
MQPQPPPEPAHRRASSSSATCSTAPRRGIGCMAGLLRLISPYHRSHHRRRLTAKNNNAAHQASAPSMPSSPTKKKPPAAAAAASLSPAPSPVKPTQQQQQPPAAVRRRRSCDAPRSPTIAPEHRRSSCDSPRPPPPAIVARLMGLEESAPPSPAAAAAAPRSAAVVANRPPPPPPAAPETAAEKRRKLLGALEKCDEDLKTLRRIIAAVRAAEMRAAAASDGAAAAAAGAAAAKSATKWMPGRDERSPSSSPSPSPPTPQQHSKLLRGVEQQLLDHHPSPDSVLDAISSPRFPCRKRPSPCTDLDAGGNTAAAAAVGSKIVKPSRTLVFTGDYCKIKSCDEPTTLRLHAVHHLVPPAGVPLRLLPRAAGAESLRHHRRRWELEAAAAGRVISRAMVESVGEAMWGPPQGGDGQRRERTMVAAALERAIVADLVADLLAELLALSGRGHGAGCRKRLCF